MEIPINVDHGDEGIPKNILILVLSLIVSSKERRSIFIRSLRRLVY